MKFKVLSHAGMAIEGNGKTILFDPWILGSCYWRSWWNFPEVDQHDIEGLRPDFIYLTHLHWDHFHGPSLRLFEREVPILVPKIPGTRMIRDLKSLKFKNIIEIPHGGKYELWDDCFLHSFQFGLFAADSLAVVSDGRTTILNANDCKIFGLPLRQIQKRFPKVDFCLRSHSSANPIPHTIENFSEKFSELRKGSDYIEEFTNFSLAVGARFAIPFASNHCFLHRDTIRFNDLSVNPKMVADFYNNHPRTKEKNSRCVVMVPGSSWDAEEGFNIKNFDFDRKSEVISSMEAKYADILERQYVKEEKARASFSSFKIYFESVFKSLPPLIGRFLFPKVLFVVDDIAGRNYWLLDPKRRLIEEHDSEVHSDFCIKVPALVINDCTRRKMFSAWTPSKRLEVRLVEGGNLRKFIIFLAILDLYENEVLPLRLNFTRRNFSIWLSRWREALEAMSLFVDLKLLKKKLVISRLYTEK